MDKSEFDCETCQDNGEIVTTVYYREYPGAAEQRDYTYVSCPLCNQ